MKIVVTGAAGFLGSRVADVLLSNTSPLPVRELIVNFDATRNLLETARKVKPSLKFIFSSTLGVYGGELPKTVDDLTAVTPENTYGTTKAMCELLINDYSRKGFVDGCILRLPTVSVRAGTANKAVTSFASGIIREPLNGLEAICPVNKNLKLWLTSPKIVVNNIIYAATIPATSFGSWRVVNLPGFAASVDEMIQALKEVAGEKVAALVSFVKDETINRIVSTFPTNIDNTRALNMGFSVDENFVEVVKQYISDDLSKD
ncbi:unnamed protein product [Chilo suppressalis]|uniref:NAD-dependent epimerase/dehydratase domain-containing protein n=1 Tax=Chilo suppressalis TaxID=168631 RepID=A0ABN8L3B6_CHISP|nr:unnamed protein product [Chilo suppressalis]